MERILCAALCLLSVTTGCGPRIGSPGPGEGADGAGTSMPSPQASDPAAVCEQWLEAWGRGVGALATDDARLVHLGRHGPVEDAVEIEFPKDPATGETNIGKVHLTAEGTDVGIRCDGSMMLANVPDWVLVPHVSVGWDGPMWMAMYDVLLDMVWDDGAWRARGFSAVLILEADSRDTALFMGGDRIWMEQSCQTSSEDLSTTLWNSDIRAYFGVTRVDSHPSETTRGYTHVLEVITCTPDHHIVGWQGIDELSITTPDAARFYDVETIDIREVTCFDESTIIVVTDELEPVAEPMGHSVPVEKTRVVLREGATFETVFEMVTARGEQGEHTDPPNLGDDAVWRAGLSFDAVPDLLPVIHLEVIAAPKPDEIGHEETYVFESGSYARQHTDAK